MIFPCLNNKGKYLIILSKKFLLNTFRTILDNGNKYTILEYHDKYIIEGKNLILRSIHLLDSVNDGIL